MKKISYKKVSSVCDYINSLGDFSSDEHIGYLNEIKSIIIEDRLKKTITSLKEMINGLDLLNRRMDELNKSIEHKANSYPTNSLGFNEVQLEYLKSINIPCNEINEIRIIANNILTLLNEQD